MSLPRTPSFRLDGKRALVAGGSRGIGLGCAVALAEAGAHVVIAARGAAQVQASVDEMAQEWGLILSYVPPVLLLPLLGLYLHFVHMMCVLIFQLSRLVHCLAIPRSSWQAWILNKLLKSLLT